MKKSQRKIIVGEKEYYWSVGGLTDEGTIVNIWKDKQIISNDVYDEPNITPKMIKSLIEGLEK